MIVPHRAAAKAASKPAKTSARSQRERTGGGVEPIAGR